jgi:ABC-2 type transport system ATP-binding protein
MSDVIIADRMVKRYGPRLAIRDVSFSVRQGEVIGLLGPNGSGKSTIMRVLTGYLLPSAGTVRVAGLDVVEDSFSVRTRIGYVPEDAPLYNGMRVSEFLLFMARIKHLSGPAARRAVAAVGERLQLERVMGVTIGKLSRGYRQRVVIAQALLNDPPILIFDEPTNALDAYQVIGVRDLIRSLAGERTILLASHVLSEIGKLATRVMMLADGRLLTADAMRASDVNRRLRLRVAGPPSAVLAELRRQPGVLAATPDTCAAEPAEHSPFRGVANVTAVPASEQPCTYLVDVDPCRRVAEELARTMTQRGFALSELVEIEPDLEHVFLELTRHVAEAA